MQTIKRTTVNLKPEIYKRLKRVAVDREQTLQQIVNEALENHLRTTQKGRTRSIRFQTFHIGKVKGRLTREEIYQDR